jgi:hypothetical protein
MKHEISIPSESRSKKIVSTLIVLVEIGSICYFIARPAWKSVSGTWNNVSGTNKGELEWVRGPDGKGMLRPVDREKDRQELLDDLKRQQDYQRKLNNEGYVPGFRP